MTTFEFAPWFRNVAPYIRLHQGKTFVIAISGKNLQHSNFFSLIGDIQLLYSLGIKIVVIHGSRYQIEQQIKREKLSTTMINGERVTDSKILAIAQKESHKITLKLVALLSHNSQQKISAETDRLLAVTGNYITAIPKGMDNGVDFQYTGTVHKMDVEGINHQLRNNMIVLVPPVSYTVAGNALNLSFEEVVIQTSSALKADKLIIYNESSLENDAQSLFSNSEFRQIVAQQTDEEEKQIFNMALEASIRGVRRVHIVNLNDVNAFLQELFSSSGLGVMVTEQPNAWLRSAESNDLQAILDLITPLQQKGFLKPRCKDSILENIDDFWVIEQDGLVIACAALHLIKGNRLHPVVGELQCLATHSQHRDVGYASQLCDVIEKTAKQLKLYKLLVLTTGATQWFVDRGYREISVKELPEVKKNQYDWERKSKIYIKDIDCAGD